MNLLICFTPFLLFKTKTALCRKWLVLCYFQVHPVIIMRNRINFPRQTEDVSDEELEAKIGKIISSYPIIRSVNSFHHFTCACSFTSLKELEITKHGGPSGLGPSARHVRFDGNFPEPAAGYAV